MFQIAVESVFSKGSDEVVINKYGLSITVADISTLKPKEWLNDQVSFSLMFLRLCSD
jgi:Ulp1 family protease